MSNASSLTIFLRQATVVGLIVFSLIMVVAGLLGLIFGRLRIGSFKLKGTALRVLSALLFLGAACYFIPKYGFPVELLLALVLVIVAVILAEKPAAARHLPAETHTYQSGPDEPAYRLHLRLEKDGSGLLIVNAATVLHLNATAAEFAYHIIKGTSPDETARQVAARYRISQEEALKDFTDFNERLQTMIHMPDLDPTTYLDFERVAPHSQELTAPLRLDCALTYRLPPDTQAEYAPPGASTASSPHRNGKPSWTRPGRSAFLTSPSLAAKRPCATICRS